MNAITLAEPRPANPLMPSDLGGAMELATMMATAKLVPAHLQGKPGDCLLVIEQSMRWGMSPFAVAQATSVIQGRLMFEGKLVAAALNASGLLSGRMSYEFEGDGPQRAVTASATIRGEPAPRTLRCTLAEARTTNSLWVKQPDQQLVYFATRAWARRHAPEVMLGVYSPEEFDAPADSFRGATIEAAAAQTMAPEPRRPDPAVYSRREAINKEVPIAPKRQTIGAWLADLRQRLAACTTMEELDEIATSKPVRDAQAGLLNGALRELNAILAEAIDRLQAHQDDAAEAAIAEDDDSFPGDKPNTPEPIHA